MADGRHFENSFIAISQPEIIRFRWNLVCRCRLCFQGRLLNKIPKFFKFKMADGRHIENRLLAISRRMIIQLTRNFVGWSRITNHQYDQNTEFRKFKMADGRHFENSFIAISRPEIIRFKWNLVCRCKLCFLGRLLNKMVKFCQFKMADGRHIENRLLAISRRMIIRLTLSLPIFWLPVPAKIFMSEKLSSNP